MDIKNVQKYENHIKKSIKTEVVKNATSTGWTVTQFSDNVITLSKKEQDVIKDNKSFEVILDEIFYIRSQNVNSDIDIFSDSPKVSLDNVSG